MTSPFDTPEFSSRLFFPRRDARPAPKGASDLRIEVERGVGLQCRLHPAREARVNLVLFPGNGETAADWDWLAPEFQRLGAALAVVSYRGYGQSDGQPSLRAALADAPRAAAAAARARGGGRPLVVMGRSLGSASAAEIARARPPLASGVVLESGFTDLRAFVQRRGLPVPERLDERDVSDFCPLGKLARGDAPLLVLHGERDTLIEAREAQAAVEASGARERTLRLIPDRGHNDLMYEPDYWQTLGAFLDAVARGG